MIICYMFLGASRCVSLLERGVWHDRIAMDAAASHGRILGAADVRPNYTSVHTEV